MGLDITVYTKLRKAAPGEGLDEDGYADEGAGYVTMYVNPDFPGRADEVEHEATYHVEEAFDFAAGSYGGYNMWREWLAMLGGYTCDKMWDEPFDAPFAELVNFADNEGVIGTAVSAKLAKDFAAHAETASLRAPERWYLERYNLWRKAFEIAAAENGVVDFH